MAGTLKTHPPTTLGHSLTGRAAGRFGALWQRLVRTSRQTLLLATVFVTCAVLVGYLLLYYDSNGIAASPPDTHSRVALNQLPFHGARAYQYLQDLCALGPRVSGTPAMEAQQKLLVEHFRERGATVRLQEFRARSPLDGSAVPMANLIAQWHPERKERILLCAHYDTRPFPDRDPDNPRGVFLGANDGASGTALLMELAEQMAALDGKLGVDFVLFDGEELVYAENDPYFLGSEYFANQYVAQPPGYRYRYGVLLDMVGDSDLQIYQERNSMSWRDTRPLVAAIWETARRLGVREFVPRKKYEIRDDHLKLHATAKIPTCDIIDFDYSAWHTTADTPQRCSAESLAKVGWVVGEWLKGAVKGS